MRQREKGEGWDCRGGSLRCCRKKAVGEVGNGRLAFDEQSVGGTFEATSESWAR